VKRVSKSFGAVRSAKEGAPREQAIHRMRKAAKRLRYALEASRGTAPRTVQRAIAKLTKLQNSLGEYQDSVVARAHLLALLRDSELCSEDTFTFGVLYQREVQIGEHAVRDLKNEWRRAERACQRIQDKQSTSRANCFTGSDERQQRPKPPQQ